MTESTEVSTSSESSTKAESSNKLIQIKNLKTYFYTEEGIVKAVDGLSFDIYENGQNSPTEVDSENNTEIIEENEE